MKKLYPLFIILFGFTAQAQNIIFASPSLKTVLVNATAGSQIAKDLSGNYFKIDSNNDFEIQLSEALQVSYLNLQAYSDIEDINGIENFTSLKTLKAPNYVSTVNLTGLVNLETFEATPNQITALDASGLPNLKELTCPFGQIASLNIAGSTNIENIHFYGNQLTSLDLTSLTNLKGLDCRNNALVSLDVSGLTQLMTLECMNNQLTTLGISGLTSLISLNAGNNQLSSLDLTGLTSLIDIECQTNQLSSLTLGTLNNVTIMDCSQNLLTSLDVSGLSSLYHFYCSVNQLSSIDISNLHLLQVFECNDNQITSLDFTGLTSLHEVACNENHIAALDVSALANLQYLLCNGNLLTSIDVSANHQMVSLGCGENPNLTTINIKNGSVEDCAIDSCPNLQYICADDNQLATVQQSITDYNLVNCELNTYCSFNPGGTYYTITGDCHYDADANGCSATDIFYPNFQLAFANGTTSGNLIADTAGNYHLDLPEGTNTITPVLENPTYFTVSPAVSTITFPTEASPFTQDFCITANGIHDDLEVVLMPLDVPRPGFDARYKIIYKNKGTRAAQSTITLTFNDAILDFVSAAPTVSSQATNSLSWSFTNLLPFETREITFTLNVNSPTETPAVNGGDVLHYTATVVGTIIEEAPNDNTSELNQTVRNGFDPNDKTCLEGTTISPAMIGSYVHYMIRFENTGTFAAQNIVVADVIDALKFDIASLIPESGSHEFITRITGNKAEFIFENINLPFDDTHNDGYVAFKIKTKPTLVVGDTFSNSANIYFDYNFPIITNTATTTIQALATQDFDFGNYFAVYPNPAKDVLNLETKTEIGLKSISIYNVLGQMVMVVTNSESTSVIDVSNLNTGTYFIKVNTDKGTAATKFIKE